MLKSFLKSFYFIPFVLFSLNSFSQDVLTKKNGSTLSIKVIEITNHEIKYKKFEYLDGPLYTISKSEVLLIRYENGTRDSFVEETENVQPEKDLLNNYDYQFYHKGQIDAKSYYKNYKTATGVTFVTSVIIPIAGLIPAITFTCFKPKEKNLGCPSSELMNNTDYMKGYKEKARKMKRNRVWKNFAIGFTTGVILGIILNNK